MSGWVSLRFLQTQSDARLLALARDGHERAFEALVHRYRKPLLAYCRRMLVPAATAEDAVQQGLLQAWVALQRGAEVRDAQPWLYRVVHNVALRMLEVSGYEHAELSESLVGAEPPQSELERRMSVRAALGVVAALPPLQPEALMRTAVDGFSHEQVAVMLGLSDGAVRGLVYRARATLRNAATVLTPFPFVEWTARAGREGAQFSERLGGLAGGGGAAGLGALVKGGATVTAGVFVVGTAVVHRRPEVHERRLQPAVSVRPASVAPAAPRGSATSPTSSYGGDTTTTPTSSGAGGNATSPTSRRASGTFRTRKVPLAPTR
jgi:RNA polymerase sigma factor (sigma-70 family)